MTPIELLKFHINDLGYIAEHDTTWNKDSIVVRYEYECYTGDGSQKIRSLWPQARVRLWIKDNLDIYYVSTSQLRTDLFFYGHGSYLANLHDPDSIQKIEEVVRGEDEQVRLS